MYGLMTLFVGAAAYALAYGLRSGSVSGDEAPKYRMLADDDAAERPGGAERRSS
jgi:hypothetical protein